MYKHWKRINRIIDQTLALDSDSRISFLEDTLGGDPDILKEAKDYLSYIEDAEHADFLKGEFLSESLLAREMSSAVKDNLSVKHIIGKRIGPYEIRDLLGEGGMGSVYHAERIDGEFTQHVAIKFLKSGFYSLYLRERFKREKNLLSRLSHPNIARLLDGGITDEGSPYLVMEYVEGDPVNVYCRKQSLKLEERLSLFQQICRAVQFAHSKLIIHRDLKPDNIFVTQNGQIKIMDFGIGKSLSPELDEEFNDFTRAGNIIASFDFAAPEQLNSDDVSIQTDVYGLGALLYLLVTDERVFDTKNKSIGEIGSIICEQSPVPPGLRAKAEIGRIPADLQAIVLKALRKEPENRYESAAHLMDDIERLKEGLPVLAKKGSFQYRTEKYIKRNKTVISGAVMLTFIALIFSNYHVHQLTKERNIAQTEADISQAVTDFMVDIFREADPSISTDSVLTAKDLLKRGEERFDRDQLKPSLKLKILTSLADANKTLGEYDTAEKLYLEADSISMAVFGEQSFEASNAKLNLGAFYYVLGNNENAGLYFKTTLPFFENHKYQYPEKYADLAYHLGNWYQRREQADSSLIYLEKSLEFYENEEAYKMRSLMIKNSIGSAYRVQGDLSKAEEMYLDAYSLVDEVENNTNLLLTTLNNLAIVYNHKEDYRKASNYFSEALKLVTDVYGVIHPYRSTILGNLVSISGNLKDMEKLKYYGDSLLQIEEQLNGLQSWQYARVLRLIGMKYYELNSFKESSATIEKSYLTFKNQLGAKHIWTTNTKIMLVFCKLNSGDQSAADQYFTESIQQLEISKESYRYNDLAHLKSILDTSGKYSSVDVENYLQPIRDLIDEI